MRRIVEPQRTKHRSKFTTTLVLFVGGHNYFSFSIIRFDFVDDCQS